MIQEHIYESNVEGCVGHELVRTDGVQTDREVERKYHRRSSTLHIPGTAAGPVRKLLARVQKEHQRGVAGLGETSNQFEA